MIKQEFISALREKLSALPQIDPEKHIQFYEEMINDRIEDGMLEEDAVADRKLLGKLRIADRNALAVANDIVGGKGEGVTVGERDAVVLEGLDSIFGALGIKQNSDGESELVSYLLDHINALLMVGVNTVGEIKSRNVHSGTAEADQYFLCITGGAKRAYYFGSSHGFLR